MLIVSKFHDYYDTAIGMGVDTECVFERKRHEEKISKDVDLLTIIDTQKKDINYLIEPFLIGFAGEFYPGVKVTKTYMEGILLCNEDFTTYKLSEWYDFLISEDILKPTRKWSYWKDIQTHKNAEEFFNPNSWKTYEKFFRKYNTPIFALVPHGKKRSGTDIIVNPVLLWYKFGRIKDAYTAFQDIHMYISGVLGVGERKMIELSDTDKRDKKGFDIFSFKKRKK
jgi:hypothetical protein